MVKSNCSETSSRIPPVLAQSVSGYPSKPRYGRRTRESLVRREMLHNWRKCTLDERGGRPVSDTSSTHAARLSRPMSVGLAAAAACLVLLSGCGRAAGNENPTARRTHPHGAARWFVTPGSNGALCQMTVAPYAPTSVLCLVGPPQVPANKAITATLTPAGHVKVCNGEGCLSNGGGPTLPYGHSIALGPFRCTALRAGVLCVVTSTGRGFLLSARRIEPIE